MVPAGQPGICYGEIDIRRLSNLLSIAHEHKLNGFEELLLLEGLGPRTLRLLAHISKVLHGTPSRFDDPARLYFPHSGKDGKTFAVRIPAYNETYSYLRRAVDRAGIGIRNGQDVTAGTEGPKPKKRTELSEKQLSLFS
jgi:hypothetical protein